NTTDGFIIHIILSGVAVYVRIYCHFLVFNKKEKKMLSNYGSYTGNNNHLLRTNLCKTSCSLTFRVSNTYGIVIKIRTQKSNRRRKNNNMRNTECLICKSDRK